MNAECEGNHIKILGTGCKNCKMLESNVIETFNALVINQSIKHVKDIAEIASYSVMQTPAPIFGNEVVCAGRALSVHEICDPIKDNRKSLE